MSIYPYTHFEILTQLDDVTNKLESNRRAFNQRLEEVESNSTPNHLYQQEKAKITQIINNLDTIAVELGAIQWIQ
jgi:hypothetical protein